MTTNPYLSKEVLQRRVFNPYYYDLHVKEFLVGKTKQYIDPKNNRNNKNKLKNEEQGFHDLRQLTSFFSEEVGDEVHATYC